MPVRWESGGGGRPPGRGLPAAAAAVVVLLLVLVIIARWDRHTAERWRPFALAERGEAGGRVVLLLADRLTYTDLLEGAGPHLSGLLRRGAVALVNVRSGRAGSESGYLSLGTAARAAAGPEGREAFGRDELIAGERAAVIFQRRTGEEPTGALLHLQVAALQERNSALPYPVSIGLLGEALRERGLTAAIWGNADGAEPNRSAVLVAMNSRGEVSGGSVGAEMLQGAPLYPYGVRTDIGMITAAVAANLESADLHLVEFGDSTRLDEYWAQLRPSRGEELLVEILDNLDLLTGQLLSALGPGDSLLLAVPSLPQNRPAGRDQLAPLILAAGGGEATGMLGSLSTRRPGLVQNTDLASLILALLDGAGRTSAATAGDSFSVIPQPDVPVTLDRLGSRWALVFEQRPALLKVYIAILVAVLLLALVGVLLRIRRALPPVSRAIGALLFVPPALLLLPGLLPYPLPTAALSGLLLGGVVLLPALLLQPLAGREQTLYWAALGWGIALLLLLDTLAGSPLQQLSLFSYDPIGGARYYGVGNEYMGVLIGSALLGTVSLTAPSGGLPPPFGGGPARGRSASPLLAPSVLLLYIIIIFVLAAPNLGANLGGCLTAAVTFGISWAGLSRGGGSAGTPGSRRLAGAILFLLLAAGLLWLLNLRRPGIPPSHVGLFAEMLQRRGAAGLGETVLRKLGMGLRLIRYSLWSRAFVTLVGLCAVLSIHPGGMLKRLQSEQPCLVAGVSAALAGAAAALLTNDSGVVAAATLLLYVVPPALLMIMHNSVQRRQV